MKAISGPVSDLIQCFHLSPSIFFSRELGSKLVHQNFGKRSFSSSSPQKQAQKKKKKKKIPPLKSIGTLVKKQQQLSQFAEVLNFAQILD